MTSDLYAARLRLLQDSTLTCVLCKDAVFYSSSQKGIAPMMTFLDDGTPLRGFSAADRIVGKAAAMLFALAGVREVFAEVITPDAIRILERYGKADGDKVVIGNSLGKISPCVLRAVSNAFAPDTPCPYGKAGLIHIVSAV